MIEERETGGENFAIVLIFGCACLWPLSANSLRCTRFLLHMGKFSCVMVYERAQALFLFHYGELRHSDCCTELNRIYFLSLRTTIIEEPVGKNIEELFSQLCRLFIVKNTVFRVPYFVQVFPMPSFPKIHLATAIMQPFSQLQGTRRKSNETSCAELHHMSSLFVLTSLDYFYRTKTRTEQAPTVMKLATAVCLLAPSNFVDDESAGFL